ncbi:MAG: PPC domain-containing protein [Planctomycetia bacterium]|nr:PPC domain-containing protein [Planctomycetia bacterium]
MSLPRIYFGYALAWSIGLSGVISETSGLAQSTPKIEYLFPAGARRGTTVEVQLGGEFMPDACRLSSDDAGISLQPSTANRYRVSVAANADSRAHDVRLASVQGASPPFPFLVGDLPEVVHVDRGKTLELKLPVTANGRLESAGDIDEYGVTLAAGTQIVCAATARAFRSPVDVMIRVLDPDGRPIAAGSPRREVDALAVFRATRAGRYTIQVFDFQLTGGSAHVYRLTVTDGPWLDYVFPYGASRTAETAATLHGWNLPSASGVTLALRIPPQSSTHYEVTLPGGANRLSIPVGESTETLEAEPNDDAEHAMPLPLDSTVNGRLAQAGDDDWFAIDAEKGAQFALRVESAELHFPTDIVAAVVDAAGKKLLETDDFKTSRDPSFRFTAPTAGRYFVMLHDRSRRGGSDFVYRLHLTALRPDVTARVNTASLTVHAAKTMTLPVLVERIDGLSDELEIAAVDLPAGVTVAPQPVPAKTPATVELSFAVTNKTAPLAKLVGVVVRSKSGSRTIARAAAIADSPTATTAVDRLWLAVSPEIPFKLKTTTTILDAPRMAAFRFPVTAEREAGFSAPIRLVGVEPDRRGTVVPLEGQVSEGESSGSIPLVIQHKTIEGTTHRCRVMGVAEVPGIDGKTYAVFQVAAGSMSIGCQPSLLTMTIDPPIVVGKPGTTQRIEVRLMRRVAMGPIKLRLHPPAGVAGLDCDSVEVGVDANLAVLTLRVADRATLPPRTTIEVKAESSHDGLPIYGTTSFRLESAR